MGLETSTTIQGLNIAWPLGTDPRSEGDNHLRLTKTVLKNVFDDSNANSLLFKVVGLRFTKSATTQALEAMQGSLLRGQLVWNVGVGQAALSRWRVYDDAGAILNSITLDGNFTLAIGNMVLSGTSAAITAVNATLTGKVKALEGEFGPTSGSGARGINLISTVDAYSGRLFWSNGSAAWVMLQADDDSLWINSGAVYGSSSGTRRVRFNTDGTSEFASNVSCSFGVRVGRDGIGGVYRGQFNIDSSHTPYIGRYGADGTTLDYRLALATNAIQGLPSAAATSNSLYLYDGQASPVARIRMWWDAATALIVRAVNAAGTELGYVGIDNSGVLIHREGNTGSSYPVVATDKLDLLTYTGSTAANLTFPIGTTVLAYSSAAVVNGTAQGVYLQTANQGYALNNTGLGQLVGTWRCRGTMQMSAGNFVNMFQRTA